MVTVVSDYAAYLKSHLIHNWCDAQSVQKIFCAPHVHKSIGLVECFKCTLTDRLHKVRHDRRGSWSNHLHHCVREYNTMEHFVAKYVQDQLWEMSESEWQLAKERTRKARDAVSAHLKRNHVDYQIGQLHD